MVKPTGSVVDMRHHIDEDTGDLPEVIPERVLSLAIFFGAIVAWVTDHLPEGDEHTNVPCRRSPGRRRCRGDIIALLDRSSGYIVWQCPLCGDQGMIHGWENTLWNRDGRSASTVERSTIDRDALTQSLDTDRQRGRGLLGSARRNDQRAAPLDAIAVSDRGPLDV